jgi:hypothetical protein
LESEISCSQWEGSACTHDGPWLVGGEGFLIFSLVPSVFLLSSQRVPKFLMCSQMHSQRYSQ